LLINNNTAGQLLFNAQLEDNLTSLASKYSNVLENIKNIEENLVHLNEKESYFDQVFLINRFHRSDRLLATTSILEAENINFKLWEAVDMDSDFIRNVRKIIIETKATARSPGELACFASHIGLLRKIVAERIPIAVILEDDIDFIAGAFDIAREMLLQIQYPWDMIFLGHCMEVESGDFISNSTNELFQLQKAIHPRCTHAYMVSFQGAKKLLKKMPSIYDMYTPLDEFYAIFSQRQEVESFSFHPVLISQYSATQSDIREESNNDIFPILPNSIRHSWEKNNT